MVAPIRGRSAAAEEGMEMLKRFRIEVEEVDATTCVESLNRYEGVLHMVECCRYGLLYAGGEMCEPANEPFTVPQWVDGESRSTFSSDKVGREVTDEVIEFDASLPGYKARRVVQFTRVDTR